MIALGFVMASDVGSILGVLPGPQGDHSAVWSVDVSCWEPPEHSVV